VLRVTNVPSVPGLFSRYHRLRRRDMQFFVKMNQCFSFLEDLAQKQQ
jgi:hypothetical protein